jgi:hypothetical protein
MNVVRKFKNKGTQFSVALHEGSGAVSDKPGFIEFLAEVAGSLLMSANALLGLALSFFPSGGKNSRAVPGDLELERTIHLAPHMTLFVSSLKAAAKPIMEKIGSDWDRSVWVNRNNFENARNWALADQSN